MTQQPTTLAAAIQRVIDAAPPGSLVVALRLVVEARHGGYETIDRKTWEMRFLRIDIEADRSSLRSYRESRDKQQVPITISFALCPFDDGNKVGRQIAPAEVLKHTTVEAITAKLAKMLTDAGDMAALYASTRTVSLPDAG